MFSIEQIELIRRLRNSGVTKEQVIEAFDSLERIDGELGSLYNVPVHRNTRTRNSNSFRTSNTGSNQVNPPSYGTQYNQDLDRHNISNRQHENIHYDSTPLNQNVSVVVLSGQENSWTQQPGEYESGPRVNGDTSSNDCIVREPIQERVSELDSRLGSNSDISSSNFAKIPHQPSRVSEYDTRPQTQRDMSSSSFTQAQHHTRVSNYSSRHTTNGDISANNFTKATRPAFQGQQSTVTKHRNSSTDAQNIAPASKIKHSSNNSDEVSPGKKPRIMRGVDIVEDSSKQVIEMIENAMKEKLSGSSSAFGQKVILPDGQEVTVSYQRRERFTFREKHLEVLESSFKENPYPSCEEREKIANMCNVACSNNGERPLYEKEKVTSHMVLNWFANSRKEVKRLAKQDGLVASASILPSRINKQKAGYVNASESTEELVISDQSNDSSQISNDEKVKEEEFIIIKCEDTDNQ